MSIVIGAVAGVLGAFLTIFINTGSAALSLEISAPGGTTACCDQLG